MHSNIVIMIVLLIMSHGKKRAWEFADYLSRSRYTTPMANTMCISPMAAHVTFSAISLLHSIVGISWCRHFDRLTTKVDCGWVTLILNSAEQRIIIQQWWLVHWSLWMGCHIWYSEAGPGRAMAPSSPLLVVPNMTAHPSTASVPTSYYSNWHYLCTLKR